MADVVASVTAVLSQTCLQAALRGAVPAVLQRHLTAVAAEARQQLLPAADAPDCALPSTQVCVLCCMRLICGACFSRLMRLARWPAFTYAFPIPTHTPQNKQQQDVAHAVHALCAARSPAATFEALDGAMAAAARHAAASAAPAVSALLPADVPPAARAAAAAAAEDGCLAGAAQRLLQQVPALVHAQLAQQADQLVRVIGRQLAVHARMTAAAAPASAPAASSAPASTSRCASSSPPAAAAPAPAPAAVASAATAAAAATEAQSAAPVAAALPAEAAEASAKPPRRPLPTDQAQQQRLQPPRPPPAPSTAGPAPLAADSGAGEPAAHRLAPVAVVSLSRGDSASCGGTGTPNAVRARRRITPMRVEGSEAAGGTGTPIARAASGSSPLVLLAAARAASDQLPFGGPTPAAAAAAARAHSGALAQSFASPPVMAAQRARTPGERLPFASAAGGDAGAADHGTPQQLGRLSRGLTPRTASAAAAAAPDGDAAAAVGTPEPSVRPTALDRAFAEASGEKAAAAEGPAVAGAAATLTPPAPPLRVRLRHSPEAEAEDLTTALLAAEPFCVAEALLLLNGGGDSGGGGGDAQAAALVCSLAARRCVAALAEGRASVRELDARMAQLVASAPGDPAAAEADGAEALPLQPRDRALLLGGALLHAHLTSAAHERAVWRERTSGDGDAGQEEEDGGEQQEQLGGLPRDLQPFVLLPTALMKAARAGAPLAVLRRLRLWLQDATLGGGGGGGESPEASDEEY